MTRGRELIERLISNPNSCDGVFANELLREFQHDLPVEALRPLLLSCDVHVLGPALFIASELGAKATPFLDVIAELLNYSDRHIRGDAISSILTCATGHNGKELAAVITLLEDSDWPIRWKTMEFMSLASQEQLEGALEYFVKSIPYSIHIRNIRWLIGQSGHDVREIVSWLKSEKSINRKYGVIAAARIADADVKCLALAESLDDEDIRQFAKSTTRALKHQLPKGDL